MSLRRRYLHGGSLVRWSHRERVDMAASEPARPPDYTRGARAPGRAPRHRARAPTPGRPRPSAPPRRPDPGVRRCCAGVPTAGARGAATWWLAVEAHTAKWEGEQVDLLLRDRLPRALAWQTSGWSAAARTSAPTRCSPRAPCGGGAAERGKSRSPQRPLRGGPKAPIRSPTRRSPSVPALPPLDRCALARFDREAWALASDLAVLAALMDEPGANNACARRVCASWTLQRLGCRGPRASWLRARAPLRC